MGKLEGLVAYKAQLVEWMARHGQWGKLTACNGQEECVAHKAPLMK